MQKAVETSKEIVVSSVEKYYDVLVIYMHKTIEAICILFIGWIGALLIRKIVTKLFKAFGIDVIAENTGLKSFMVRNGINKNISALIGVAFYWLIILVALVMVFNTYEMQAASNVLWLVAVYIPRIIIAVVIIAIGLRLGQILGVIVDTRARNANIAFASVLGKIANVSIIGLAIMIALEYLSIAPIFISQLFVFIFCIVPLIAAIVIAVAGKDVLSNVFAGKMIKKTYAVGEEINADSVSGTIVSIDIMTTKLENGNQEIIVPNTELAKKVIKRNKS
ncbi:MAG: mechanosensitive ion channel [Candidatus Ancaeobacter aquaticus]|nr:mechanosensitive ion channel [Candidatus Ancaeobacter aquaticus]